LGVNLQKQGGGLPKLRVGRCNNQNRENQKGDKSTHTEKEGRNGRDVMSRLHR